MAQNNNPPNPLDPSRPRYPTPQTGAMPVVKSSSRFWSYLYNDPRRRLLLLSAIIATGYFIFRVIDAVLLYQSIYGVLAPLSTTSEEVVVQSTWSFFRIYLPIIHYVGLAIGMVFNWIAWRVPRPWIALVAILAYLVGAIGYIRWGAFFLPEIILTLLGYMATVRKRNAWL